MAFTQLLVAGMALATRLEDARQVRVVEKEVVKPYLIREPAPAVPAVSPGSSVVSRPPVPPPAAPLAVPATPVAPPLIAVPRVGQEVVVEFLDGDPDRPLVTGHVWNEARMPPWELPKHATASGIKTHSTKEGGADNHNELRFEDDKGKEHIWFQAEKDFHRLVKLPFQR